jgi:hypothetical protein
LHPDLRTRERRLQTRLDRAADARAAFIELEHDEFELLEREVAASQRFWASDLGSLISWRGVRVIQRDECEFVRLVREQFGRQEHVQPPILSSLSMTNNLPSS